jgi:hypothetical protein
MCLPRSYQSRVCRLADAIITGWAEGICLPLAGLATIWAWPERLLGSAVARHVATIMKLKSPRNYEDRILTARPTS